MGVFGAIGNALKKPVQAAGKVVGKAPGMGSVGKTVGKAPGMGMVGRGLGLGPSPAATPQMGQMAQNVGGQMMPPPPPQPMPDSQDMPPAMQQVPGQMGGGAMQGPMQNQEIRPDIMQAMKQKMMQQPGQPGVGGIGPSFGGQGIGRGPMMRNPRMM